MAGAPTPNSPRVETPPKPERESVFKQAAARRLAMKPAPTPSMPYGNNTRTRPAGPRTYLKRMF